MSRRLKGVLGCAIVWYTFVQNLVDFYHIHIHIHIRLIIQLTHRNMSTKIKQMIKKR